LPRNERWDFVWIVPLGTGIHESAFDTVTNLAKVLQVPVAYFYFEDDRLADFLVTYTKLNAGQKSHRATISTRR
jgi:hypothetical protein